MKWTTKGLLFGCLVAVGSGDLRGQTTVGFRAGYASSTLTGDDLTQIGRRQGFSAGGFVGIGLGAALGLEFGAAYTQKGVSTRDGGTDVDLSLAYVEMPFLLKLSAPVAGRISPHLYLGPVVSTESDCEATGTQVELSRSFNCDDPVLGGDLDRNSLDVGAMFGAGLSTRLSAGIGVSLDAMYNLGLRSIDAEESDFANRNQALMLVAGLSIAIGG